MCVCVCVFWERVLLLCLNGFCVFNLPPSDWSKYIFLSANK